MRSRTSLVCTLPSNQSLLAGCDDNSPLREGDMGSVCHPSQFLWDFMYQGHGNFSLSRCTELSRDSPCYTRITGRNSNHSFPQNLPSVMTDSNTVPIWFAVLDTLSPPPNPTCIDAVHHITCGAAAPPCDPSTQRALPVCNDSCRAYKQLLSDGQCDDFDAFVRQFAAATPTQDARALVDLYFNFDCDNISTYLFGSYLDFVSQTRCTNLLGEDHTDEMIEYTNDVTLVVTQLLGHQNVLMWVRIWFTCT